MLFTASHLKDGFKSYEHKRKKMREVTIWNLKALFNIRNSSRNTEHVCKMTNMNTTYKEIWGEIVLFLPQGFMDNNSFALNSFKLSKGI